MTKQLLKFKVGDTVTAGIGGEAAQRSCTVIGVDYDKLSYTLQRGELIRRDVHWLHVHEPPRPRTR